MSWLPWVGTERVSEVLHSFRYDTLTGLPARLTFNDQLPRMLKYAVKRGYTLVVGVVDFNLLKEVNNDYGHYAGDQLLRHGALAMSEYLLHACPSGHRKPHCCHQLSQFPHLMPRTYSPAAAELEAALRAGRLCLEDMPTPECALAHRQLALHPCHILARVGGDEFFFAFLIRDAATPAEAEAKALALVNGMVSSIHGTTHFVRRPEDSADLAPAMLPTANLSIAVGLACTDEYVSLEWLMHAADLAMYEAKQRTKEDGLPGAVLADASFHLRQASERRIELEQHEAASDPRKRLRRIQPVVGVDGSIVGGLVRVLPTRWWDRDPTGLMITDDLGHYARAVPALFRELLEWQADCTARGIELPLLYVPVTAKYLRTGGLQHLTELFSQYEASAKRLVLRISGLARDDRRTMLPILTTLKPFVYGLAIDGFGGAGTPDVKALSAYYRYMVAVLLDPLLLAEDTDETLGEQLRAITHLMAEAESLPCQVVITGVDTPGQHQYLDWLRNAFLVGPVLHDITSQMVVAAKTRDSRLLAGASLDPPLAPETFVTAVQAGYQYELNTLSDPPDWPSLHIPHQQPVPQAAPE